MNPYWWTVEYPGKTGFILAAIFVAYVMWG